jgi:hypothetical protein
LSFAVTDADCCITSPPNLFVVDVVIVDVVSLSLFVVIVVRRRRCSSSSLFVVVVVRRRRCSSSSLFVVVETSNHQHYRAGSIRQCNGRVVSVDLSR